MEGFDETYTGARQRGSASKKKNSIKTDWLVRLSAAQLTLACVGVVLLLLVSKASPKTFSALRAEFHEIMSVDMSAKEVVASLKSINILPKEKSTEPLSAEESESTSEPETEEENETETEQESSTGKGGDDIELYNATSDVCFAPFCTTVPLTKPVSGEITSHFGYRTHPITGKFGIHNGTDYSADSGTPIAAALGGTVEEIGYNDIRGKYILLSHGADTKTLYMHCSEIIAPEGAVVRQGEVIAKVGSTGWSTGPHLHFSIIIGGRYCNPEWLI